MVKNRIALLYKGLEILFNYNNHELIDFTDTDFHVIPKCQDFSSAPAHSNSGYISVAASDEIADHTRLLEIEGWSYDYPYYTFYMW